MLTGCGRKASLLPAASPSTTTTQVSTIPAAIATQTPISTTSTPEHINTPIVITPSIATSIPEPQPLITYTSWELVHDLVWSPDGSRLAVSAGDWVHIYDGITLEELQVLYTGAWAVDMDYLHADMLVLAAKDGSLQFWEAENGSLICSMQAHAKGANSLDIDSNGTLLASVGNDALVRLWDLSQVINGSGFSSDGQVCNLELKAELIGAAFSVPTVRFNPDGTLIASIDLQVVRLRDPLTQRLVSSLRAGNSLFDITFSPNGRLLATAELANQVRLWEVSSGEILYTLTNNDDAGNFMWCITFSPGGEFLAAGSSDGMISLWDTASGELLDIIAAHSRAVTTLAFSPDGKWLASGSLESNVRLWEVGE